MSPLPSSTADQVREILVGLKMARSLETLDDVLRRLEQGSLSALEAIHQLLAEVEASRSPIFSSSAAQRIWR